jgi:hypothetical protein
MLLLLCWDGIAGFRFAIVLSCCFFSAGVGGAGDMIGADEVLNSARKVEPGPFASPQDSCEMRKQPWCLHWGFSFS